SIRIGRTRHGPTPTAGGDLPHSGRRSRRCRSPGGWRSSISARPASDDHHRRRRHIRSDGDIETGGRPVLAPRAGDETRSDAAANLRNDPRFRNLVRLYPITRIAVEDVRSLPMLDGAFSGGDGFPYVCRRVRIVVPSAGVLSVDASPGDYHLTQPGPFMYPDNTTSHLSIRVVAGEAHIDVLLPGYLLNKVPPFTLRSSLAPN